MENRKVLIFAFTTGAIISNVTWLKHFDFRSFTFGKPALAVVYAIGFVIFIVRIRKMRGVNISPAFFSGQLLTIFCR